MSTVRQRLEQLELQKKYDARTPQHEGHARAERLAANAKAHLQNERGLLVIEQVLANASVTERAEVMRRVAADPLWTEDQRTGRDGGEAFGCTLEEIRREQ